MNLFAISPKEKQNIKYDARPELVMPANINALPDPDAGTENAGNENWPVSPEQRIAAVRAAAPDEEWRGSEDLPTEYLTSEKDGIRNSSRIYRSSRANARSGGGEQFIEEFRNDATGTGTSAEVKKRREQLAYSTGGAQRKFLTEPPTEYRTPSENAEAGDLGITKEELTAQQKQAERERIDISNGILTPGVQ